MGVCANAQHLSKKVDDSTNATPEYLEKVVLTGQYNPQLVNKSVFEVQVIPQEEIKRLAGNTLADVLTQTLNLNVIPNPGEGRSGIQQFGFNAEYVKILVDGIPIIGDEGFGNAIDITQINLDDIKRIEIVEGAMGVQYGANAVTGVVNIITKKSANKKWIITPYVQEETIGDEYGLFDAGRHIQSIKVGHNFSENWYAEATYTRNDFQGFLDDKHGEDYYNTLDATDDSRGYAWLPKEQNTVKGLINFHKNNVRLFYKFEYFNELTNKYANTVRLNPNNATQTFDPTASDAIFRTDRMYHHLNASGKIAHKLNYNVSLSYQDQTRNIEKYTYTLKTGEKSNIKRYDYNSRKGIFSRGTLSNLFSSPHFRMQLGYAFTMDEGSASGLSSQDAATNTQENTIRSYSGFASAEIKVTPRLSLRPGVRWMASSMFAPQYTLSFSGKYQFNHGYQLRAIVGTAPKTPTFEQLYFYMVDSNHNVQGNEDLSPEYGKSIFLHLKKTFHWNDYELTYTPKLSAWYLDVDDKIDLIIVDPSPLAYKYENINSFRTWGLSLRNNLRYNNLSASLGVSFSGQSKKLDAVKNANDDYLYSVQINSQLAYEVPRWNTVFSAFFKYNGPVYQFVNTVDNAGNTQTVKAKQDGYSWLTASIRKSFFNDRLNVTLGARNLLDVTDIKTGGILGSGSGHSAAANSIMMSYGRSYFLKLLYNFKF